MSNKHNPVTLTDEITVRLIDHMGNDTSIAAAAWVSTSGAAAEIKAAEDFERMPGLINYLMKHHHGTPFEHAAMTFRVDAPIFVFREWHRHRVGWSYNEQSGRYSKLEPVFWKPPRDRPLMPVEGFKPARPEFQMSEDRDYNAFLRQVTHIYQLQYQTYEGLLEHGFAKEAARCILPVGIYSSMYATCNPRSLMHFLSLRTHDKTAQFVSFPQREIQQAAYQMENIFAQLFPSAYKAFNKNGRVAP